MRSTTYQIAATLLMICSQAMALDLTNYENTCADIGFKKKTPAFGECVLELHSREGKTSPAKQKQVQATNNQGDGTPDHATCAKYGFQAGTTEYSQCRMQIDTARTQARQQQNEYEQQLAAQKKAKEEAQGEALFLLGMGMLSGSAPKRSNFNNSFIEPPQLDRIYNLPGGKFMRCSTMGMVTNCR